MTMDSDVVARIESFRARRVGEMMVTKFPNDFEAEPAPVLVDIENLNGEQLLATYLAKQAKFGTTPFDPMGDKFRLYPGGVTIWSGWPGAGKTTLLRQLVCHILARGSSVFLASLEEDPQAVLVRLAGTACGRMEPDGELLQWFIDSYAKRFRLWGVIGITEHLKLLAVIRKLATEGIRHAVIDSLMFLDIDNKDFDAQRRFAVLLAATARTANIHIHLVAHPRKLLNASQEPDLNDVAGAREIGAMADNVVFVRKGQDDAYQVDSSVTPMRVGIKKQRHFNGQLGDVTGWYHRNHRQFLLDQFARPIRYLPDAAWHDESRTA